MLDAYEQTRKKICVVCGNIAGMKRSRRPLASLTVWVMASLKTITPFTPVLRGFSIEGRWIGVKKEQKARIKVVVKTIGESKKIVVELRDSVDPVSPVVDSLKGIDPFLEELQQEVSEELSKKVQKTLARKLADFFLTLLHWPVNKLLQGLWANAVVVARQILGRD